MVEEQCGLCLKKTKELEKKNYLRVGKVALCKECNGDVEYLAKLKGRTEGWTYQQLFQGKKNFKKPKEIYEKNNDGHHELENDRPEE